MDRFLQISLLIVAIAQVLHGPIRYLLLAVGLVGLFVPWLFLSCDQIRWPLGVWAYLLLLAAIGAMQSISTADYWPLVSAFVLACALLVFLSIGPRIVQGVTKGTATSMLLIFLLATAYSTVDPAYVVTLISSAPLVGMASIVLVGMTFRPRYVLVIGALLFVLLVLVWDSRAEALAVLVYVATSIFRESKGGIRKLGTVVAAVSVFALFTVNQYWSTALKLNDEYRGISSGLTGRVTGFRHSVDLISERPLIGVGYRRQELYFQDVGYWVGRTEYPLTSSHNGILGLLIEWGAIGSLLLLLPLIVRARPFRQSLRDTAALSALASFITFITFERYYINFGNMYSVLMVALFIYWLRLEGQSVAPVPTAEPKPQS